MRWWMAFVLIWLLAFGCAQQGGNTTSPAQGSTNNAVIIKDFAYTPNETIIHMGMTVTWVNDDAVPHSVVFADGNSSGVLAPGQNYSRTFSSPGDYNYSCGIHPFMTGSVRVLGAPD